MSGLTPVLPSCTFGNLFYFYQFLKPKVVLDIGENYPKQTWRNRYDIIAANGPLSLTVPIVGLKGKKVPVREIQIDHSVDWPAQHWKTVVSAYRSSPYFEHYADDLKPLFEEAPELLSDFNLQTIRLLLDWLQLNPDLEISSEYVHSEVHHQDLRAFLKPSKFNHHAIETEPYFQVFSDKQSFQPNCSVLDLVFNLGPEAGSHLRQIRVRESQITNLGR